MKWIKYFLFVVLAGMLAVRTGVFVVRIVREWNQPASEWQPANENEVKIWRNFQEVGE